MGLPYVEGIERARRPARIPVVFTRQEVGAMLSRLPGAYRLVGGLLYGSGLRPTEALRLRVKDLDFDYGEVPVRDGKGEKDRRTLLPRPLAEALGRQLERVKALHEQDPFRLSLLLNPNQSFDENPLVGDEEIFPHESTPDRGHLGPLNLEQVVDYLWRNGQAPQWIDVSVQLVTTSIHTFSFYVAEDLRLWMKCFITGIKVIRHFTL